MSLEKLFTGSAIAKILDVLWEYQDIDLTLTDIADEAEIHYTTLMKALPLLEELGMVTMMRQVGNAKLYQRKRGSQTGNACASKKNGYCLTGYSEA